MTEWDQVTPEALIYQTSISKVYKLQYQGNPCVVKYSRFPSEEDSLRAIDALKIQQTLSDLQVCKVIGYTIDHQHLRVLQESVDRDLDAEIKLRKSQGNYWNCEELIVHFYTLIATFASAQSLRICHRNIKPKSLFVKGEEILVAEFECAKEEADDFLSPELRANIHNSLSSSIVYNPYKSDVYSLGLTFLFMWYGKESEELKSMNTLAEGMEAVLSGIWSEEVRRLLARMLTIEARYRPDFQQLLSETMIENPDFLNYLFPSPETQKGNSHCPQYQLLRKAVFNYLILQLNSENSSNLSSILKFTFRAGTSLLFTCRIKCSCHFCQREFDVTVSSKANEHSYVICSNDCFKQYILTPLRNPSLLSRYKNQTYGVCFLPPSHTYDPTTLTSKVYETFAQGSNSELQSVFPGTEGDTFSYTETDTQQLPSVPATPPIDTAQAGSSTPQLSLCQGQSDLTRGDGLIRINSTAPKGAGCVLS